MALIFSVSGVRGIVGSELTPEVAAAVGRAFGSFLGGGRVVLGRDTRRSGPTMRDGVARGLRAGGCTVLDVGVASTPGTALMVRKVGADGGVVITASHNPPEYNGIKLLSSQGWTLPAEQAERVRRIWQEGQFGSQAVDDSGSPETLAGVHEEHVSATLRIVDAAAIAKRRLRVVLDSINGAGCVGTAMLLDRLGCELVHINSEPNGKFAHMPEPIAENLDQLYQAVERERADVGFAQDPDADRLVVVDESGTFIGEEYTLPLAAQPVLSERPGSMAANLSTSRLIDEVAGRVGCTVYRTPVGEAHVAQEMMARGCVFGGEGNGGVIDPRVVPVRDSFVAIALMCQLITSSGKSVSELVAELPRYAMVKRKFSCDAVRAARVLAAVREGFAGGRINEADGVRVDLAEGWVHVRASNTEPIMRIIAEADNEEQALRLIDRAERIAAEVG